MATKLLGSCAVLAAACCAAAGALAVEPDALFGPQTYEVTPGPTIQYTDDFSLEHGGPAVLYVRNGDDETSRVDDVSISLNGAVVVPAGELGADRAGLKRPVQLLSGDNELEISLDGAPGSFVTVLLGVPNRPPLFVTGRLLLAWGRNDDQRTLALALKNGSPRHPRRLRVLFFDPDGTLAAASERIVLPPHGSIALPVDELIDAGAWSVGSVEIVYSGRGAARAFGVASHFGLPPAVQAEAVPLANAGYQVYRGQPEPAPGPASRRRGT